MRPTAPPRKHGLIASIFILVLGLGATQAQAVAGYALRISGKKWDDTAKAMAVDKVGNAYVVGDFHAESIQIGNMTFKNQGKTGQSADPSADSFLAKIDSSGDLEWAFVFGGDMDDVVQDVVVDPDGGNVFLTGTFQSEVLTFGDAGPPVYNLIYGLADEPEYNTYLMRVDAEGTVIWVTQTGDSDVGSIVVDAARDCLFLSGSFPGEPPVSEENESNFGSKFSAGLEDDDTDDGRGSGELMGKKEGGDGLFKKGSLDIYVDHYSYRTGDLMSGITFTGDRDDVNTDMAILPKSSALLITGYFYSDVLTLDEMSVLRSENPNKRRADPTGFLARLDSIYGHVMWGQEVGEIASSPPLQVAADEASESLFITGNFLGRSILARSDGKSAGLISLSLKTGSIQWVKAVPAPASIVVDYLGFLYISGTTTKDTPFGANGGLISIGSDAGDIYVARLQAEDGTILFDRSFGGEGKRGAYSVATVGVDAENNVYLAGNYSKGSLVLGGQALDSPGTDVDGFVGRAVMGSEAPVSTLAGPNQPATAQRTKKRKKIFGKSTSTKASSKNSGWFSGNLFSPSSDSASSAAAPLPPTPQETSYDPDSPSSPSSSSPKATDTNVARPSATTPAQSLPPTSGPVASPADNPMPESAPETSRTPVRIPTHAPTGRPPRFRLTWAPTPSRPLGQDPLYGSSETATYSDVTATTGSQAAIYPLPPGTTNDDATLLSLLGRGKVASGGDDVLRGWDVDMVYAGPTTDVSALQTATYNVVKPYVTSFVSLPVSRLGSDRRRRVLLNQRVLPDDACANPEAPKIHLRFALQCSSDADAAHVQDSLAQVATGNLTLRSGRRTIPSSLICSLNVTSAPVPTPSPTASPQEMVPKESPRPKPSDSTTLILKDGSKKEPQTKNPPSKNVLGISLVVCLLGLVALMGVMGYRQYKRDRVIRAENDRRDMEWLRARKEQARRDGKELSEDRKATPETRGTPVSERQLPVSLTLEELSLEREEEGGP